MPRSRRRWRSTAATLALFALLLAWGVLRLRAMPPAPALREPRVVAVRDAAAAADGTTPARLQGTLVAAPALLAPDGQEYALQLLAIEPRDRDDGGDRDGDGGGAYRRVQPAEVFLSDGDSVVVVEPADVDPSFLPLLASGATGARGRLPLEVAAHVVPGFTDLPADSGARVTLRGVRAGLPVAAYGTLALREGVPSLLAPVNGDPFVLTPESIAEVERSLSRRGRLGRLGAWALVVVGALGAFGTVVARLRR